MTQFNGNLATNLPIIFSGLAILISLWSYLNNASISVRPILIFYWGDNCWNVRNVGKGAAVNVNIGELDRKRDWCCIVKCPSLNVNDSRPLKWAKHEIAFAVVYTDLFGKQFTTYCEYNTNKCYSKNLYPKWKDAIPEEYAIFKQHPDNESKLTESDLVGMNALELDLMRNEIYARHGLKFRHPHLSEHFQKQINWYAPNTYDWTEVVRRLSATERFEVALIYDYQCRSGKIVDDTE